MVHPRLHPKALAAPNIFAQLSPTCLHEQRLPTCLCTALTDSDTVKLGVSFAAILSHDQLHPIQWTYTEVVFKIAKKNYLEKYLRQWSFIKPKK